MTLKLSDTVKPYCNFDKINGSSLIRDKEGYLYGRLGVSKCIDRLIIVYKCLKRVGGKERKPLHEEENYPLKLLNSIKHSIPKFPLSMNAAPMSPNTSTH